MIFFKRSHKIDKPRYKRVLPGDKNQRSRRSVLVSRVIFYVLLISFLGVTAYIFLFSSLLKINTISTQGINELKYEKIAATINFSLEGKYLGILSRDNLLLIPEKKLAGSLMDNFKKIRSVEIKRIFPNTLKITIYERKSLVVLCAGGPCYLLDERGYAYAGVDIDSREVKENNLVQIIDESAKPVSIGEKILNEEYINFVAAVRETLNREASISISNEYHMPSRVAEEIQVHTGEGWDIYFSSSLPLEKSIRMLKTFLEEEMKNGLREKLEYVDLRVEDKIYYKLKEDEELKENNQQESAVQQKSDSEEKSNKKKK